MRIVFDARGINNVLTVEIYGIYALANTEEALT